MALAASVSVRADDALNFFWRELIWNGGNEICTPDLMGFGVSYNTSVLGQIETLQIWFPNTVGPFCEFNETFPLDMSLSRVNYYNNANLDFYINLSGQIILRSDVEVTGKFINTTFTDVKAFIDYEGLFSVNFSIDDSRNCSVAAHAVNTTKFDNIVIRTNDGNEQPIWSAVANSDETDLKSTLEDFSESNFVDYISSLDLCKRLTQSTV